MSDEPHPDLAALRDLVSSYGWKLYTARIEREYSDEAFGRAVDQISQATVSDEQLVKKILAMREERKRVLAMLRWPEAEINVLTPAKPRNPLDLLRRISR